MSYQKIAPNRKKTLVTLFFVAIIAMGVLFIINNAKSLEIAFYFVGIIVVALAIYILIFFIKNYTRLKQIHALHGSGSLFSSPFMYIFLMIMTLVSGITIIINANKGIDFYQGALASIFFFRSLHRFSQAYYLKKSAQTNRATVLIVLGCIGAGISLFLYFFAGAELVVGIVAGVALILEGLYGLYRIWGSLMLRNMKKGRSNIHFSANKSHDGYCDTQEILITDYEIVDDDKNN